MRVPAPSRRLEREIMRILLVEDEARLARLIQTGLTEEGHALDTASSGEEALDWTAVAEYDAIILDVLLPDMSGLDVCRAIRRKRVRTPILLLTALGSVENRVAGLDAGADDYLAKPFAFAELFARLRALGRRPVESLDPVLTVADLRLDPASRRVWRGNEEHVLPNKEFRILEYLMRYPNRVLTRTMIGEHVWDYEFLSGTNVIDVHIRSLRSKLDDPYPIKRIMTVRGVGYKLVGGDD